MEYNVEKKEIKSNRILSELDRMTLSFLNVLKKYTDYVVISGYVSILLGRTRITEDVDIFIKKISEIGFFNLYSKLKERGFECINAENPKEIYSYLCGGLAVRFSRENSPVPNFEVKFPKRDIDNEIFEDFLTVILDNGEIKISSLERHIAFKRYYLGSDKDIEDAEHIERIFENQIDYNKVNKFKEIIEKINEKERKNASQY